MSKHLFIGGHMHGQVMDIARNPWTVQTLDTSRVPRLWDSLVSIPQVAYNRERVAVLGRVYDVYRAADDMSIGTAESYMSDVLDRALDAELERRFAAR